MLHDGLAYQTGELHEHREEHSMTQYAFLLEPLAETPNART